MPQDTFLLKALRLATGCTICPYMALESDIEKALAEPEPATEEDEGLLHPVVHVDEGRRVEDTHERVQPLVELPKHIGLDRLDSLLGLLKLLKALSF